MGSTRPLTIGYIGNTRHPWCTELHIAADLRLLGHTVTMFQEPSDRSYVLPFLDEIETWCQREWPDLLMFTRTWGLPTATDLWRRLEGIGIVTCSYHLDLYVGLQREAGIETDPFWTTQHVFTPDGDLNSAEFFKSKGINHHWSSPAVVSSECGPGVFDPRFDFDVVFVGSENYHPEWPWRPQLLRFLRARYGDRFRRFSGDQPEGPIRGQDLNNLYATARVVVGDSLCLPGHQNYWSDRFFETVGRGGFLVGPLVPGIKQFLTGDHMALYNPGDLGHVGALVDYYLAHPDEAKAIARQGQAHVKANHTYQHRLAEALKVMGFDEPEATIVPDVWEDFAIWRPESIVKIVDLIDKLELGSGFHPTPGFTHLDLNPDTNPDIVGPAFPLDLADCSVGEIRAVDVLEHLPYTHTDAILTDWFRVLKPGGKIYIQVPDADMIMEWYAKSDRRLVERIPAHLPQTPISGAAWRLLGGLDDGVNAKTAATAHLNLHMALFNNVSLREALERAGFENVAMTSNPHPNLLCHATKPKES